MQFWLWHKEYTRKFFATPKSDQALSPPWYKAEVSRPHSRDSNSTGATFVEGNNRVNAGGAVTQDLHFDHVHRPSSPNLSRLDTQSLASTTSTTLYHADSVDDIDMQIGLQCKTGTSLLWHNDVLKLSLHSYHPTIPFRDQPCHLTLSQSWLEQRA